MNINSAFPSKYLKAADADEPIILTITKVKVETIGQGPKAEQKPVIYFKEVEKGMVCNKTNAKIISGICKSDDTDDWSGKQIKLIATEVEFQGDLIMSLRVRSVEKSKVAKSAPTEEGVEAPSEDSIPF